MVYVCDMVYSATRLCKKLYFGIFFIYFVCVCFSIFPVLGQIWFCLLPLYHNLILSSHLNHATPQGPSLSDTKIICCMFQVFVMTAQGRSHICVYLCTCLCMFVCFWGKTQCSCTAPGLVFSFWLQTDLLFRIWCKTGRGLGRQIPISRPQDRRKPLLNCGLSWTWCWSLVYTWSLLINKPI